MNIFRRAPKQEEDNLTVDGLTNTVLATRKDRSSWESSARREKGTDMDLIDPNEIIEKVEKIAYYTVVKSFPRLINVAAEGSPPDYKVMMIAENIEYVREWAVTLLGYMDKIWATIMMEKYEANTMKLRIRTAFHQLKRDMPPEDRVKYRSLVTMVFNLVLARCEDMKDGQKALLLKVNREQVSVKMSRSGSNEPGGR